jgi:4-amino-4-deoxy-L-arabinose transferase-like glycosyltransferase
MPFLLLSALLPWLLAGIGTRWFGAVAGWRAGMLVLLMPLSGSLGIMAVPDVPMAFATVLCLDAGARLLREVDAAAAAELALGLVIGALSHYRFVGVIGVGCIALLLLPEGRRVLRDVRVWVALALGIAAWMPLIAWNIENADAGLRFQLVDRHPWTFQLTGLLFLGIQAALVTPLLFYALLQVLGRALRAGREVPAQWRYFGLLGGLSTIGFFVLGFFADVERVSFHWPLPGYLPLLLVVPALLRRWPRAWRRAAWAMCGAGLAVVLGYYLVASVPRSWRAIRARPACWRITSRWVPSWGSRWATTQSRCWTIRSTSSTDARRSCVCGTWKAMAPAPRRSCWSSAPARCNTRACWPSTTHSARGSVRCHRRA